MRWLGFVGWLMLCTTLAPELARAQFQGYPSTSSFLVGQGVTGPPIWKSLSDTQGVLQLGTMAYQNATSVSVTGGTITGMANPLNPQDVANKAYVDGITIGFVAHTQSRLATTAALPSNTYNNGTMGAGATLTATANAALAIDGISVVGNDRVIVKNEAAAANNGIYTVTQAGDATHPYILTRATDANTTGTGDPNKIGFSSYSFVTAGTVNGNTGWMVNNSVVTLGTDPIIWIQFNAGTASGVGSLNGLLGQLTIGPAVSSSGTKITMPGIQPQGRLTLQTGAPVMTASVVGQTLYYDCYHGGNLVPVYNGTADVLLPIAGCEISTTLQASGIGLIANNDIFDVWAINVGGVLALCVATNGVAGQGWSGDSSGSLTARGSTYTKLNTFTRGYITNDQTITNCYQGATQRGPIAANQATFLGTFWSGPAGNASYTPSPALGTASCLCLWNAYNQVMASGVAGYALSSWAVGNTSVSTPIARLFTVRGLSEHSLTAHVRQNSIAQSGITCYTLLALDGSVVYLALLGPAGSTINQTLTINEDFSVDFNNMLGGHQWTQHYQGNTGTAASCTFFGGALSNSNIAVRTRL
jgi:hypothetical protein